MVEFNQAHSKRCAYVFDPSAHFGKLIRCSSCHTNNRWVRGTDPDIISFLTARYHNAH